MSKNAKVERILDEIGERKNSDRLLKLKDDSAEDLDAPVNAKSAPSHRSEEKSAGSPASKKKFIDNEYNFSLKPRIVIKWMVVLILFVSVFYLGRLTASPAEAILEETPEIEVKSSFITSLSGFFTSIIPDMSEEDGTEAATEPAPAAEPAAAAEDTAAPTEEAPAAEANTTEEAAPAEDDQPETVVTTYAKVDFEFLDITKEWKTTWGKITKVTYKITNKEAGTIEPDHFVMIVTGYEDDFEHKTIPLPAGSKSIKSGTAISTTANVPSGFAYSGVEVGDLSNAIITLQLYDANEKLIGAKSKAFNLKG